MAAILGLSAALGLAGAAASSEPTVFDLFDRGVASIVAANACGDEGVPGFARFTADFTKVANAVEDELLRMNPGHSRGDLAMVIGFRVAQLEHRTETTVATAGCNAPEVQRLRALATGTTQLSAL